MQYEAWRDGHVETARERFTTETLYGRMGARVPDDVLREAHRLATLRLSEIAEGNPNWRFSPIAFLGKYLLDWVLDRVLDKFGLTGWRKLVAKVAIEILVLVLVTALLTGPKASENYGAPEGLDDELQQFAREAAECERS